MKSLVLVCALAGVASAKPVVTISPKSVHPGDPVLVSVTGVDEAPSAKAGGQPRAVFAARRGFQAVFAVPLNIDEDHVIIEVAGEAKPSNVPALAKKFGETKRVVEEEYANPSPEDGKLIDADNAAITASYKDAGGDAQFEHAFRQPRGAVTGKFGEWRTFQDGHRAQHLGLDLDEAEGSKVAAVDDGTVVLVRETFLAGNVVVIAHGAGIASMYFHLQKATVHTTKKVVHKTGDALEDGADAIGDTGETVVHSAGTAAGDAAHSVSKTKIHAGLSGTANTGRAGVKAHAGVSNGTHDFGTKAGVGVNAGNGNAGVRANVGGDVDKNEAGLNGGVGAHAKDGKAGIDTRAGATAGSHDVGAKAGLGAKADDGTAGINAKTSVDADQHAAGVTGGVTGTAKAGNVGVGTSAGVKAGTHKAGVKGHVGAKAKNDEAGVGAGAGVLL